MAHASLRGSRLGRTLALAAALAVVGGLTLALPQPAPVRADAPKPATSSTGETVQFINDQLEASWKDNKITPSAHCDDYEFIRRASLDIIGRIATPKEIDTFLAEPRETRRAQLIERLLKSEEYPNHWADLWANWLLTRSGVFGHGTYKEQLHTWLADQFATNKSYDKIVRDLVTATGKNNGDGSLSGNKDNGAVNFILAHLGEEVPAKERGAAEGRWQMVPITSRMTRLFLGVQTQCAQCHDHPFDKRVLQPNFWGINAFLRQVDRVGNPPMMRGNRDMTFGPLELVVKSDYNQNGRVPYEKRNLVVLYTKPTFLDGTKVTDLKEDRRVELAKLMIEHDNFPKAYVNRLWAHFLGRGIITPIDDFNDQNTASYPELLDGLAKKFRHYGFDQKELIRWICNSNAYSLSCRANKTNDKPESEPYFSRMLLKVMSPEELFESILTATQMETTAEGKKDARAKWMERLVANFGDDEGNEVNYSGTVVQALLLMNGEDINKAIALEKGTVAQALKKSGSAQGAINDLYLATLNRKPTVDELKKLANAMVLTRPGPGGTMVPVPEKEHAAAFHDLMWALLNSNEFILNH
jgi:Protein of unknown function (DUF1549)/Protein of unknown function (DUF1553)